MRRLLAGADAREHQLSGKLVGENVVHGDMLLIAGRDILKHQAGATFPHGWGVVRVSKTQPVLVMRFEAETEQYLKQYRHEMEQVVEEAKRAVAHA